MNMRLVIYYNTSIYDALVFLTQQTHANQPQLAALAVNHKRNCTILQELTN